MRSLEVRRCVLLARLVAVLVVSGCNLVPQPQPPEPRPPGVSEGPGGGAADAAIGDAGSSVPVGADGSSDATTEATDASLGPDGAYSWDAPAAPPSDAGGDAESDAGNGLGLVDCQQEGSQVGPEGGE